MESDSKINYLLVDYLRSIYHLWCSNVPLHMTDIERCSQLSNYASFGHTSHPGFRPDIARMEMFRSTSAVTLNDFFPFGLGAECQAGYLRHKDIEVYLTLLKKMLISVFMMLARKIGACAILEDSSFSNSTRMWTRVLEIEIVRVWCQTLWSFTCTWHVSLWNGRFSKGEIYGGNYFSLFLANEVSFWE